MREKDLARILFLLQRCQMMECAHRENPRSLLRRLHRNRPHPDRKLSEMIASPVLDSISRPHATRRPIQHERLPLLPHKILDQAQGACQLQPRHPLVLDRQREDFQTGRDTLLKRLAKMTGFGMHSGGCAVLRMHLATLSTNPAEPLKQVIYLIAIFAASRFVCYGHAK
jgi:hypothetical protein